MVFQTAFLLSGGLAAVFHQPLFFPFPVGFFHALAFVVLFFAFGQADVHFDIAAFVVHIERDEGIAAAFDFADELVDFALLQQQFTLADGVGFDVGGGGGQGGDVAADQVECPFFPVYVAFFELHPSGADGFDLPAVQYQAGFEFVFDKVVVKGFFIVGNAHFSIRCFFQTALYQILRHSPLPPYSEGGV